MLASFPLKHPFKTTSGVNVPCYWVEVSIVNAHVQSYRGCWQTATGGDVFVAGVFKMFCST
jgi:hypothetical protein